MNNLQNKIPQKVKKLCQKIINHGFECFLVGGCVRDLILKKNIKDWDVATNATPNQLKNIFKNEVLIDVNSSLGTLIVNGIEITTFRKDGTYSNKRRPDNVIWAGSLKEDVLRRDLTINGLAMDLKGNIIDLVGGLKDINDKIIRCIGNPDKRFQEDALRILRAIRFASVLGFDCDLNTLISIKRNKYLLQIISKERIREELNKIVCGKDFYKVGLLYKDILFTAVPGLSELDVEHNNHHHFLDVYEHTLLCVVNVKSNQYIDKIAALLHDLGKKQSKTIDNVTHENHFYNHAIKSVEIARNILNTLRYSNQDKNKILWLVKEHGHLFVNSIKVFKRWWATIPNKFDKWEMLNRLLLLRQADRSAVVNTTFSDMSDEQVRAIAKQIITKDNALTIKDLTVDGYDVMKYGFNGKEIGIILHKLLNRIIASEITNDREFLLHEIVKLSKEKKHKN